MTYKPQPIKVEGGQEEVRTSDDNVEGLLESILIELRKLNLYHALMNDITIKNHDVEG